jgi:antitoxin MazE
MGSSNRFSMMILSQYSMISKFVNFFDNKQGKNEKKLAFFTGSNYIVGMNAKIVKIGNSQGIRIPKILLEQSGLENEVELIVEKDQLIIRSKKRMREGWEPAFSAMAENEDDKLIIADDGSELSSWDDEEWEW